MTTAEALDVRGPVRLEAELVAPPTRPRLALVLCHGLPSGSPPDPDDPGYPGLARHFASLGYAAARFSFRGCYGSEGDLSLGGWIEDLEAVVSAVSDRTGTDIVVVASSLGGAVALLEAPTDERVRALATWAAPADFDSLTAGDGGAALLERVRTAGLFRTPGYPPDVDAWGREFTRRRPSEAASRLGDRRLLVVHGGRDDVVGVEHAHAIAAAANGPVTKVVLPEAGHQLRRDPTAVALVESWLAQIR